MPNTANAIGAGTRRSSGNTTALPWSQAWLDDTGPVRSFQLDPQLFLAGGPLYSSRGADRLTGSFTDCSPDRWGKTLMARREAIKAKEEGRKVRNLRDWDHLVGVDDESRMGALRLRDSEGVFRDTRGLSAPPAAELECHLSGSRFGAVAPLSWQT